MEPARVEPLFSTDGKMLRPCRVAELELLGSHTILLSTYCIDDYFSGHLDIK